MKLAIVAAVCVGRDAISAAAASQADLAARFPEVESVDVFASYVGRPVGVANHIVHDAWTLLNHPRFRDADVAIFHWGIFHPLFDALTVLAAGAGPHPVLMFHNMTPPDLVDDEELRARLDQSRTQLAHLTSLPIRCWTYSEENRQVLLDAAVDPQRIAFVPFPIDPPRALVDRRSADPIRLLTVGRLARAKGTDVLIEAVGRLVADVGPGLRLDLVGNPHFSDAALVARLDRRIAELGLESVVRVRADVDDDGLWDLLEAAHVVVCPSLHEGLCVPVVEAYLAGCRVVAADAGNLRYIVQDPDPVVRAGDHEALAAALRAVIDDVRTGRGVAPDAARAVVDAYSGATAERALRAALQAVRAPGPGRELAWPAAISTSRADRRFAVEPRPVAAEGR